MSPPDELDELVPTFSPQRVEFPYGNSSSESIANSGRDHDPSQSRQRQQTGRPAPFKAATEQSQSVQNTAPVRHLDRRATGGSLLAYHANDWVAPSSDSGLTSCSSSSSDEDGGVPEAKKRRFRPTRGRTFSAKHTAASKGKSTPDGKQYSRFLIGNDEFSTRGRVSKHDGRLNMSVSETANSGYLAKALGATLTHHLGRGRKTETGAGQLDSPTVQRMDKGRPRVSRASTASTAVAEGEFPRPTLNIVIMVIGSRGDIQPFLKIGKVLKEEHGHRVRIATHPAFKKFVEKDSGLEFFSVGGDPSELMAFMVKNPGLIPSMATVKAGEIGRRREQMFQMFQGFWRACINATDEETDQANRQMMADKHPFVADAIIANPPSFAHVHCAERLGVPLHLMFTFPYSPTQAFPHPLANIKKTNMDMNYTNFMSYPLVEMMTWQGLGDLINRFRVKTLQLEPVSTLWAPGQLYRLKVPYTYLWSPGLVPKPEDWGPEIDIAGFVFLDLASSFTPPDSLREFLDAGDPPVYIGFGSIVVDDPDQFTATVFEAVEKAGVRALVSKGWGGLGGGDVPANIYMLENTPHDWLFPRVSAVIHHGGAGTTAIGLKCGRPTMVVPFFGDQPFWGAMIARSGAGAHEAVPYKNLTVDRLAKGILECLSTEAQASAARLAKDITEEGDGAQNAVKSFHRSLAFRGEHSMRCAMLEDRVAVWNLKHTGLRLSALAAEILTEKKKTTRRSLRLLRHCEWNDFDGPGEPFTGGGAALASSITAVAKGFGGVPVRMVKSIKRHERREAKRRRKPQMANAEQDRKQDEAIREEPPKTGEGDGPEVPGPANRTFKMTKSNSHPTLGGFAGQAEIAEGHQGDEETVMAEDGDENIVQDLAADAGRGFENAGQALAKAPMDLSLAVAQGFHNAPRLYGDSTVRRPVRISGFRSGLRAARDEFVYGIYDGVTGLVLHPYKGVRDDGALGFVTGVGRGVGGFVLKDLAAIFGPFGYTLKGIHKELQKGKQPTHFIRKARFIQGEKDMRDLDAEMRKKAIETVSRGWDIFLEVKTLGDEKRAEGIRGKIQHRQEKRAWRRHGALENVDQAQRALEAKRKGEDFEEVFRGQREELARAQGPRKSTMTGDKQMDKKGASKKQMAMTEAGRKQMSGVKRTEVQTNGSVEDGA